MINLVVHALLAVAGVALFYWMAHSRWTACQCGRERLPWFLVQHSKEWVMLTVTVVCAVSAVGNALYGHMFLAVMVGLVGVLEARVLYEHRKGKRSILGRLLGKVVVTEHGTLGVDLTPEQ